MAVYAGAMSRGSQWGGGSKGRALAFQVERHKGAEMKLSHADVERVGLLARLELSADEVSTFATQLSDVLKYFELLSELNTDGVEPMAHAIELTNVLVPDIGRASLPREDALRNAPKHDDECYRVPAVLGD